MTGHSPRFDLEITGGQQYVIERANDLVKRHGPYESFAEARKLIRDRTRALARTSQDKEEK